MPTDCCHNVSHNKLPFTDSLQQCLLTAVTIQALYRFLSCNSIQPKYTILRNVNSFLRKWLTIVHITVNNSVTTDNKFTFWQPTDQPQSIPVIIVTSDWYCNRVNWNMFSSVATCDAICNLNKLPPGLHQQQLFQTKFKQFPQPQKSSRTAHPTEPHHSHVTVTTYLHRLALRGKTTHLHPG
jgi:hypothetical protein